ncbi:hypothetical protein GJ496_001113 [Pomphorhynchus laevis]|nr:hypothetical protein GJ496_001113 [Pomphorhynchus laevis]
MSLLDKTYRSLNPLRMFANGFGCYKLIEDLRHARHDLSERKYRNDIVSINTMTSLEDTCIQTISFTSPAIHYLRIPEHLKKGRIQLINAIKAKYETKGLCIILATTGDHGLNLRTRLIGLPLLEKYNISSIILENPYYGSRKPDNQLRSALLHISDLFLMGLVIIIECNHLYRWSLENGLINRNTPLIICGSSLGGYMGSLVTASHPNNLPNLLSVLALCGISAAPVFTQGVMSKSINWKLIADQTDEFLKYFPAMCPRDSEYSSKELFAKRVAGNLLNYFTNMNQWESPLNPQFVTLIEAAYDQYIPSKYGQKPLKQLWKDIPVIEQIKGGHVSGTILSYKDLMVKSIGNAVLQYSKCNVINY